MGQPPLDELRERAVEARFGAAQCGLTILRYLTDHAPGLSLSVLARIVSTPPPDHACAQRTQLAIRGCGHLAADALLAGSAPEGALPTDAITALHAAITVRALPRLLPRLLQVSTNDAALTLLPLLERPPWVRRGRGGAVEKHIGGVWQAVPPEERYRLTQQDGQVRQAWPCIAVDGRAPGTATWGMLPANHLTGREECVPLLICYIVQPSAARVAVPPAPCNRCGLRCTTCWQTARRAPGWT